MRFVRWFIPIFLLALSSSLFAIPYSSGRFTELPSGIPFVVVKENRGVLIFNERKALTGLGFGAWKGFQFIWGAKLKTQPTAFFDFSGRILVAAVSQDHDVVIYREKSAGNRDFDQYRLPQADEWGNGISYLADEEPRMIRHRDGTISLYVQDLNGNIYRSKFTRDGKWSNYQWLGAPNEGANPGFTAGMGLGGEHYVFAQNKETGKLYFRAQEFDQGAFGYWNIIDSDLNMEDFTAGLEVINDRKGRLFLTHTNGRVMYFRQLGAKPNSPWDRGSTIGSGRYFVHPTKLIRWAENICMLVHDDYGGSLDRFCEQGGENFSGQYGYLNGPFPHNMHVYVDYKQQIRTLGLDKNGYIHDTYPGAFDDHMENWLAGLFGGPFGGL